MSKPDDLSLDRPLLERLEKASAILANDDYTPPMTADRTRHIFVTETIIDARKVLRTRSSGDGAVVSTLQKHLWFFKRLARALIRKNSGRFEDAWTLDGKRLEGIIDEIEAALAKIGGG